MANTKIITLSLVIGTLVLSGCSGPTVEEPINLYRPTPAASTLPTSLPEQQTNQTTQTLPSTQQESMKTLEDFQPISATQATITTTKGDITVELYPDKAPTTVTNFLTLAKDGFYDGIVFHRVIPDFMAQVGDPLTKDESQQARWGTGGPGYTILDEFNADLKHDAEGVLSMANTGQPNTGGSQFFITFAATPWLDGKHAVFGKVTNGLETLRQIEMGDKIISINYQ